MTENKPTAGEAKDAAPQLPPAPDGRPSILFAAPMNILDITSGAALSMRTLLSALASRGFRAVALQASLFDSEQGAEHVIEAGAGEAVKDKQILRSMVLGVEHLIVRTKATKRPDMTSQEEEIFIRKFREELKMRRPDMIILWGGLLLEMTIMREAREAGIPVVFYLVNAGYKNIDNFRYVSVVVTDTEATAKLYKDRLGLNCHPVGKFIDPKLIKAEERKPDFITFINPSFEKGVNVFLPLAKLAAKECPEIKFLVVQSRGRWGIAMQVLKFQPSDFPNVRVIGHQRNMRPVYGATKALLLPSVWHESGARVIAEAIINGIPVLASDTGGSGRAGGQGRQGLRVPGHRQGKAGPAGHRGGGAPVAGGDQAHLARPRLLRGTQRARGQGGRAARHPAQHGPVPRGGVAGGAAKQTGPVTEAGAGQGHEVGREAGAGPQAEENGQGPLNAART